MISKNCFENQVVIITGAGSRQGIGRSLALTFAKEGAKVVIADVNFVGAKKVQEEIENLGMNNRILAIKVDVSSEKDVKKLVDITIREFNYIDVLVNNAGITQSIKVLETSVEEWDRIMSINLKGNFLCSKHVLPHMIERKYGRIVNISSICGKGGGLFGGAHYSASKAGILGFTRTLAREVAEYGITVNSVTPGAVDTEFRGHRLSVQEKEELLKTIPVKRIGNTEDVVGCVLFLASPESSYITGEDIDVNGGAYMD